MQLTFRILDIDVHRARRTEMHLLSSIRVHGINARVYQVLDHLEVGRTGIKRMPALELNDVILFQGIPLSKTLLDDVCKSLMNAKEKS